ncbi:MAG TPA: transporter substrate-binding domain-containing protein [Azospirillaceae bacterium]|nr:transporter substrate-binding domain-containing protein [Azospirillaceae bacterium]
MRRLILAGLLVFLGVSRAWAADVRLLNYYDLPPFLTGQNQGLTYALASYLTKKSDGKYTFVVENLPRRRFDAVLAEGKPVAVAWAVPAFVGDKEQAKYKWSPAVLADANVVVSRKDRPFEYTGPESLAGKTLGGVAGYVYGPIDPLVDAGKIKREDAATELLNLRKVTEGRVDATVLAETAANYLIKTEGLSDKLHISATPHSKYDRHVFVAGNDPELADFIAKTVGGMAADPEWKTASGPFLK